MSSALFCQKPGDRNYRWTPHKKTKQINKTKNKKKNAHKNTFSLTLQLMNEIIYKQSQSHTQTDFVRYFNTFQSQKLAK